MVGEWRPRHVAARQLRARKWRRWSQMLMTTQTTEDRTLQRGCTSRENYATSRYSMHDEQADRLKVGTQKVISKLTEFSLVIARLY